MKSNHPLKQTIKFLYVASATFIILITGCKTGELKDQLATLSEKQTFLAAERDSLQRMLDLKTREVDTVYKNFNALSTDYKTLNTKNKSLQSGYYTRGEQLKKATQKNDELNNTMVAENSKNDSLNKEILTLQQRIAMIDAMITEAKKSNKELAQMLDEQEEKRIADSTALANKPKPVLPPDESGFINITEFGGGFGLGDVSVDYSRSLVSLTTIGGFRINNHFMTGIGVGAHAYNGGMMIPLYIDMRYTFKGSAFVPFIVADGGMLLNPRDFMSSGLFINPGVGLTREVSKKLTLNLSTGLLIQQAPVGFRSSFINFKGGISFRGK